MIIYNPEVVSRWIVALIFLVGGILNVIGIRPVREEFTRWGLKPWMRVGTGLSELVIATTLLMNIFVVQSLLAAVMIMMSAVAVIIYNKESNRAWVPGIVIFLIALSLSFEL
ncbi:hypothetical protein GBS67_14830 [Salmonella enterica subsp. enterica serovar Typhimurium]|nr:hypothetical protein [Salmonella enterica subsp. enterica serovar Typhimurium]